MIRARLTVTYSDDIRTAYGQLISKSPLIFKMNAFMPSFLEDAEEMTIQWHEAGASKCYLVEMVSINKNDINLKAIKEFYGKHESAHKVEYKGFFDIKKIKPEEYASYARLAERSNSSEKNSVVSKIQSSIPSETATNQQLFRFLLELDSKIDKLIYLSESKAREEGFQTVKALYISSEGCGFFSAENIKIGEQFFIEVRSFDTGGKLKFSSACRVRNVRKTKLGYHVDLEFTDLPEAVKENIIRYVFEKDRELLKEASDK